CEVKTERANEWRLLFILHSRDLDAEKLKWIYIVRGIGIIKYTLDEELTTYIGSIKHYRIPQFL
ncbi:hypothetical protein CN524_22960, partial [Bacillus sp. AFS019443]